MKMTEGRTNEMAESGKRRRQIGVLKYDKTKRTQKERKCAITHVRGLIWKYSRFQDLPV